MSRIKQEVRNEAKTTMCMMPYNTTNIFSKGRIKQDMLKCKGNEEIKGTN
jgi:hypothetical protein